MTRNRIREVAVSAFPVMVLVQCSTFYMLPFLVPFITGAAVALYGAVLLAVALWHFGSKREMAQALVVGLIAITWLGWVFIPTKELAVHVRFWLQHSKYDQVVAQIARGEQPSCLATSDCILDSNVVPYVVFPFPGLLSAWIGVVHVPELDRAPNIERLKSVGSDPGCDPNPIAPHYYICGFY